MHERRTGFTRKLGPQVRIFPEACGVALPLNWAANQNRRLLGLVTSRSARWWVPNRFYMDERDSVALMSFQNKPVDGALISSLRPKPHGLSSLDTQDQYCVTSYKGLLRGMCEVQFRRIAKRRVVMSPSAPVRRMSQTRLVLRRCTIVYSRGYRASFMTLQRYAAIESSAGE